MKKLIILFGILFCLMGCNNAADSMTENEAASKDYGKVIELAKTEFNYIFEEFEDVQIEETVTMARTDDENKFIVQIKYSSNKGSGVYGFIYSLEDYANPELIQHGENVTVDNLLQ